jgi:hypothetical protein
MHTPGGISSYVEIAAGGRKACRESTASHPPGSVVFVSVLFCLITIGAGYCLLPLPAAWRSKETFRLAIEKAVGREGLKCGYHTAWRGGCRANHRTGRQGFAKKEIARFRQDLVGLGKGMFHFLRIFPRC